MGCVVALTLICLSLCVVEGVFKRAYLGRKETLVIIEPQSLKIELHLLTKGKASHSIVISHEVTEG